MLLFDDIEFMEKILPLKENKENVNNPLEIQIENENNCIIIPSSSFFNQSLADTTFYFIDSAIEHNSTIDNHSTIENNILNILEDNSIDFLNIDNIIEEHRRGISVTKLANKYNINREQILQINSRCKEKNQDLWTVEEIKNLNYYYKKGYSIPMIAKTMAKTATSVGCKLVKLGYTI